MQSTLRHVDKPPSPGLQTLLRKLMRRVLPLNYLGLMPFETIARPQEVPFFDGKSRKVGIELAELFSVWAEYADLMEESKAIYGVYEGGDFIDVGAYHGWFAAVLSPKARPADRFILFEPDPGAWSLLHAHLGQLCAVFPDLKIHLEPAACGDGTAVARVFRDGAEVHPSYAPSQEGVCSMTIDATVAAAGLKPRLIKIDVEGAEAAVLRGAAETLRKFKPSLHIEIHPQFGENGSDESLIDSLCRDYDYGKTQVGVRHWILKA